MENTTNFGSLEKRLTSLARDGKLTRESAASTLERYFPNVSENKLKNAFDYATKRNPKTLKYMAMRAEGLEKSGAATNLGADTSMGVGHLPLGLTLKALATGQKLISRVPDAIAYGRDTGGYGRAAAETLKSVGRTLGEWLPGSSVFNAYKGSGHISYQAARGLMHEMRDFIEDSEKEAALEKHKARRIGTPFGKKLTA